MMQSELNQQVAHATGETVSTIRDLGFVPLTDKPVEREPRFVDWDEVESRRDVVFPVPQRAACGAV